MLKFLTAGESHGKCIMGILQGLPANLKINFDKVDTELKARQGGYGRGMRMAIECDTAEFLCGIRGGIATGAPIGFSLENKDYKNWQGIIGAKATAINERVLTAVRPGHADLAGCIKYSQRDARNILERASARSTAATVVIGSLCGQFLEQLDISVNAQVLSIGGETEEDNIKKRIDEAHQKGDTLGGEIRLIVSGLWVGIGSHVSCEQRLEYIISANLAAINGIKSVAFGNASDYKRKTGSEMHDTMHLNDAKKIIRKTNNAGGIEGGITNGEQLVITLIAKPIPSVPMGLPSVDLLTKKAAVSANERGDTCAVEATAVVAKAVLNYSIAKTILENLGGDHMDEILERANKKRGASSL